MKHQVDIIEVGRAGNGLYLCYMVDGEQYDVTGEFYIDRDNNLHHTHITPDGEEIEIVAPYE